MATPGRRSLLDVAALAVATAFGLGYLPRAPGTFGTLAAIPLWLAWTGLPLWAHVLATAAVIGIAVAAAARAERIYGGHDVQHIVIDEVAGLLTATIGVPFAWPEVVAAFISFRALDMFKPPPIGWIDEHVGGGLGVVADDVVAGLFVLALLHGARVALGGWW